MATMARPSTVAAGSGNEMSMVTSVTWWNYLRMIGPMTPTTTASKEEEDAYTPAQPTPQEILAAVCEKYVPVLRKLGGYSPTTEREASRDLEVLAEMSPLLAEVNRAEWADE